jgi:hypothetical protein
MASSAALRQCPAATKRPPRPSPLGASLFSCSPLRALNNPHHSTPLNHQLCLRSRRSYVLHPFLFPSPTKFPTSDIQGHGERPDDIPAVVQVARLVPWSFERLLAAGLVPLTTPAFVTSGSTAPLLDGHLGVSLIALRPFLSLLECALIAATTDVLLLKV